MAPAFSPDAVLLPRVISQCLKGRDQKEKLKKIQWLEPIRLFPGERPIVIQITDLPAN